MRTDRELLREADPAAFGALFERHGRAVYNYCFRRTADWAAAEDLTSVVFLEAWRKRKGLRLHGESLLPWLYGVATNVLRNRSRALRRYHAALERLPRGHEADFADDAADRIDDERRMRDVLDALRMLPKRDRDILALCVWQGLSYEEAAVALELPVGTVRSRLARARGRLQVNAEISEAKEGIRRMNDFQIPTERDLPRGQLERRTSHLVRELARSTRRHRLTLSLVPAVAVLLTAATGFTAYTLLRTEPSHFESIGCYDRASLDANVTVVSSDGNGPIAQCRRLWMKGDVGAAVPARLAACVLETGPIGVFPSSGPQTCARLGLADVSAAALQESKRFARLQDAIIARIGVPPSGSTRGTGCVGEERAQVIVRHELVVHGYADWKILTAGGVFTPERPCAEVSFDTGAKTVFLIPGLRK